MCTRSATATTRRLAATLAVAGAVGLGGAVAAETPDLVAAMLDNAPRAAEDRCSYTRTRIRDGEARTERFHAGNPLPWELLAMNGRPPTVAELEAYADGDDERERRHPLAFDLRTMVDPGYWQLDSQTDALAHFSFRLRPNEELDEALVDKVAGTLVLDKARAQPVRITIENTEPAYVAPFVRVAEYRQDMHFEWDAGVGAAVLATTETRMRGRAMGFKSLRRDRQVKYSDYRCVEPATVAAD